MSEQTAIEFEKKYLLKDAKELTAQIRHHQEQVATVATQRRHLWADLSAKGLSQKEIAQNSDVVEHTVYTELRKLREGK
tara:strand:+ start:352 stop:588 length:237 start_codon:yes stop_codon:yes gene_type:complete